MRSSLLTILFSKSGGTWVRKNLASYLSPLAASLLLLSCQRETTVERTASFFGSYFRVKAVGDPRVINKALDEVFSEMKRYHNQFSVFSPESELSKLNSTGKGKASADLRNIIRIAEEVSNLTGGAFDITIYPLMEIWGFYERKYSIPEEREIKDARQLVDYKRIRIANDSVYLPPKTKIDLGGIAVGYSVDRACEILKRWGVKRCLIDAGGDIRVFGEIDYKIGIKHPREDKVIEKLTLRNCAVATSGDYENYFEVAGKRFSHILDPRTGWPQTNVMSVTVIGKETVFCDALATAIFVLGERGEEVIKRLPGYRAIVYLMAGEEVKRVEW